MSGEPTLELLPEKILIGRKTRMSFVENRTRELWQSFMPRRREIANVVNTILYSVEQYDSHFFDAFNPAAEFTKWAVVEVSGADHVPDGMEVLVVPSGQYAVFIHKGPASKGAETYEYIFRTWLPASAYALDDRPHFALMGDKYKHDDPDSEEEIWIPVKPFVS
ncbi:MAG: GyrI-like domain-containing protein [Saprospiraceae bacterium]|nr:GyrI-like domain-containing protein [Candidatus Opimibacter iunctus]